MKTLITFVYIERDDEIIQDNLRFFLKHGVLGNDDYHYNFVINGHECSVDIPELDNVSIIKRDNVGYDFGAYGASLESVEVNDYDYFIFINDTVRGPLFPTYIPSKITWVDMFLSKLDDKVNLAGPTWYNTKKKLRRGRHKELMPHIQSMSFATDRECIGLLLKTDIFNSSAIVKLGRPAKKLQYVLAHEVEMTRCLVDAGYDIKPFQLSSGGTIDEHDDINYEGEYFGTTLNPLEVMFIKTNRIYDDIVRNYTKWLGLYRERNTTVGKAIKLDTAGSDLAEIKAYQIYYDESQKDSLMDGFVPHFNEKATINLESGIICDLVDQGECSNCDWFGVFSWKVGDKIEGFDFETLKNVVGENGDCDLLVPNPSNYTRGGFKTPHRIQSKLNTGRRNSPNDFSTQIAFQLLLEKMIEHGIIKKPKRNFLRMVRNVVYFNAFLAKQSVYEDYVNSLLKPTIDMIDVDKELYETMIEPTQNYKSPPKNFTEDTGLTYYPHLPFILERLINLYIDVNDLKVGWVL